MEQNIEKTQGLEITENNIDEQAEAERVFFEDMDSDTYAMVNDWSDLVFQCDGCEECNLDMDDRLDILTDTLTDCFQKFGGLPDREAFVEIAQQQKTTFEQKKKLEFDAQDAEIRSAMSESEKFFRFFDEPNSFHGIKLHNKYEILKIAKDRGHIDDVDFSMVEAIIQVCFDNALKRMHSKKSLKHQDNQEIK